MESPFDQSSPSLPTNCSHLHIQSIPVSRPNQHSSETNFFSYIQSHKPQLKDIIINRYTTTTSFQLSGLVVDMFCVSMIDLGTELGVPSYFFLTCGAAYMGYAFYLSSQTEFDDEVELEKTDLVCHIPTYANPVPGNILPGLSLSKKYNIFARIGGEVKKTKGIIINTVLELETHAIRALSDGVAPQVYTVGPLLNIKGKTDHDRRPDHDQIMGWLDDQPSKSVVFLCFGTNGYFSRDQLKEIAFGLERSGQRFLWSVRKAPTEGRGVPQDYTNLAEDLPNGFLERTKDMGRVCGLAHQTEILELRAVGGFVSHCGWNSVLESLWFGVPILTWPMYVEQHINAFQLVRDLELSLELRINYRGYGGGGDVVGAEEIERAVRYLMTDGDGGLLRKKVAEMSEVCRRAVSEGGSTHQSFGCFFNAVLANLDRQ